MSEQEINQKRNIAATSIASPFAGMVARFVMHPIDTVKAKVQVSRIALKSLTDYKSGMVGNIGKFLFIQSSKPSRTKVLLDSSEASRFQSLAALWLSPFTWQAMNTQNTF
jgi:hypothetical protein